MEQKEGVANEITGNTDLKRKECNPSLKPEGHNMMESPIMCAPLGSDWPESSLQNYTNTLEATELHRCVGSESSCSTPCSKNDASVLVEELTVGDYSTMDLALVSRPSSSRQGQWQNLQQLASVSGYNAFHGDSMSQDKDGIVLTVREQCIKMTSDMKSPNFLSRQQIDRGPEEISPYIRARNNMIISSNTTPIASNQLKTLSAAGYSQLFVKKTLKGKGIIGRSTDARREFGSAVAGHNDEKLGCVTKVGSDSFLKSRANDDQLSSHRVNRPGHKSFSDRICLREWLKPGCRKREKVESLHIFRQIVELVDSAQSQGLALKDLRPTYLYLGPLNRVVYTGSFINREPESAINRDQNKKRPLQQHMQAHFGLGVKQQKHSYNKKSIAQQPQFTSSCSSRIKKVDEIYFHVNSLQGCGYFGIHTQNHSSYQSTSTTTKQQSFCETAELEKKWYTSPEELNDSSCLFSSNIYGLGLLLFEVRKNVVE